MRSGEQPNGEIYRVYYIACEEEEWDYAPWGVDILTNKGFNVATSEYHSPSMWTGRVVKGNDNATFLQNRVGSKFKKARFVRYTNSLFEKRWVDHSGKSEHLGILGPIIRATTGETLKIFFKNNCSARPYSIHAHGGIRVGFKKISIFPSSFDPVCQPNFLYLISNYTLLVFYDKQSEGAPYHDTAGVPDIGGRVNFGDTYIYTWPVLERSGPSENDPSSVVWFYHSHVDETEDVNSGLVGPLIVSRADSATRAAIPLDVDTELVAYFGIFDESRSWYINENLKTYTNLTETSKIVQIKNEEMFRRASAKYTLNGRIYGNINGFNTTQGDRVRWYVMALGTADWIQTDLHGAHWHGNTVQWKGNRVDTVPLMPGISLTADMEVDSGPAEWFFHCHTNHHMHAGMVGLYYVNECESCSKDEDESEKPTAGSIILSVFLFVTILGVCVGAWYFFGKWKKSRIRGKSSQTELASLGEERSFRQEFTNLEEGE